MTSAISSPSGLRIWTWLGLLAWCGYLAVGIFPAVPLEGDEQGVIAGASAMARHADAYLDLRYNFEIQPGSYVVLSSLARATSVDLTTLFAALTAAGAAAFAIVGVALVSRALNVRWPLVTTAFLLCQEISAGAFYMNTTALGAALALGAVTLAVTPLSPRRTAIAIALLAVAGWLRIDCVLISPALPALVWMRTHAWGATCRETAPVALGAIVLMTALYFASGVSPLNIASIYSVRGGSEGWMRTIVMMPVITSYLLAALLLIGAVLAVHSRNWALLLVASAGAALSFAVYGDSLASNKYLYLATPFFILLAVYGARELQALACGWPRVVRVAMLAGMGALLLFDTLVGVRSSEDRYRSFQPHPTLATLVSIPLSGRPLRLTLGPGELLKTSDGFRLRTGALFAPLAWRVAKIEMRARLATLSEIIARPGDCTLFHSGWLPYQIAVRQLLAAGFEFAGAPHQSQPFPFNGRWARGEKSVELAYLAYTDSEYFDPKAKPTTRTGTATYFVGDQNAFHEITPLVGSARWQLVPGWSHGYITLHQLQ